MWAPIDINAMPSSEDLLNATKAIDQVEHELREALLSLEQARLRVADLEKELQQRRAWISPIRRLNFDLLCRVFEFAGEDDWKAPLRLASVSQSWRAIVLRTPRAWSFLDLRQKQNPRLTNLYLERSGQRLLHIGISGHPSLTTLAPMKDRLQCLSVDTLPLFIGKIVFPRVTKLYVRNADAGIFPASVTREYFPALRHFHFQSKVIRLENNIGFTYDPPPLETLSLPVSSDATWIPFIRGCSETLTSLLLELRGIITSSGQRQSITMPSLKCLQVSGRMVHAGIWPLDLKTPVLESYIPNRGNSATDMLVHSDLETVQQMRLTSVRPLNHCSSLRYLQIFNWHTVLYPILTMLEKDAALCPKLEVIVVPVQRGCRLEEEAEFTRRVEELMVRRTKLKILPEHGSMERLAGEMNPSCGQDMPCN